MNRTIYLEEIETALALFYEQRLSVVELEYQTELSYPILYGIIYGYHTLNLTPAQIQQRLKLINSKLNNFEVEAIMNGHIRII